MISPIDAVYLSVSDLADSMRFYAAIPGWEVVYQGSLRAADIGELWGYHQQADVNVALLRHVASDYGKLKLLEFPGDSRQPIRNPNRVADVGLFDIDLMVTDIEACVKYMIERGARPGPCGPVRYSLGDVPVAEALVYGPDGEAIVLIERLAAPAAAAAGQTGFRYSEIATSAQIVAHLETSMAFYRDVLGLTLYRQAELREPQVEVMLGLPAGQPLRLAIFTAGESLSGKIELVDFPGLPGENRSTLAHPPNLGFFMYSFLVDDLDALYQRLVEAKITISCAPRRVDFGPEGVQEAMSVLSPDGLRLEFRQAV